MKSDINRLMADRQLDAILIAGGEGYSVVRSYMANGAHITRGLIVQKLGTSPIIFANGMELQEAAKSGLDVRNDADLEYGLLLEQYAADLPQAETIFWSRALKTAGVESGRIGVYGTGEINQYIEYVQRANDTLSEYQFVGESGQTLFETAMLTKDDEEIERIRSVAERTSEVLEETWNYIASQNVNGTQLENADGEPVTIGDIKRFVRRALMDRGLEDTGMIFAQGHDAGFPHSRGEADEPLELGKSIVFDLFPRELGGGYHHDVTRTWCIGYAPESVQVAYDQVMSALDIAIETFGVNKPTHLMQEAVLDYFEDLGHATIRSQPGALEGYVHSLGHGMGINIHEQPAISHRSKHDIFEVGNVVTIEPGLYYPEKGFGVRVEDTMVVTNDGELISLTPFRKDLVIPIDAK